MGVTDSPSYEAGGEDGNLPDDSLPGGEEPVAGGEADMGGDAGMLPRDAQHQPEVSAASKE